MSILDANDCERLKEEGNDAFKRSDWEKAIVLYTKAIKLSHSCDNNLAIYYKNRAAAYLKQNKFENALEDCNKSLEISPTDPKALFRRCQALENLQRFEEAYRDARQILNDDPNNKLIQPILQRLHAIVQERAEKNAQVTTRVESMKTIAFDINGDKEKRETAMNNLMVLARENAGSEIIIKSSIVHEIKRLLKVEKNREIFVTGIRIIGELCKHGPERTTEVLKLLGAPWFLLTLDSNCEKQVSAAQYCIQIILNSFSGMGNKSDAKLVAELCRKYKTEIDTLLSCLVCAVNIRAISGLARDAIVEVLMRNIDHSALDWAEQFVDMGGIGRLMECASELEEYKYESMMNITSSTRTIVSACLARIYDNMYYDAAKKKYMDKIDEFINDRLLTPNIESKVRVTVALTCLLRGPLDIGNSIISREGILEMILVMGNSEDSLQQKVACECIVAAASKQDKAKSIINQGVGILKNLYKSASDPVRVRALVGLCKLGSSGGTDSAIKPFSEGSSVKLAEACRKFLLHPGEDQDLRKWAAEGLAYLTLDAEVKEKLVEDRAALQALIELGKTGDQSVTYGVITTLVNLCNAYEKQEIIPEMVELAKFAKQHIPEEHELDDIDFISKRILILGREGVTTALIALSKTESDNSKELIARVFNALCGEQELRGPIVQQGAVKALINMALKGTEKGKRHASQALARIAITTNPEVAFPGQRSLEVIRPLLSSLHTECKALENFEALMGLCNIAQMNETARQRILKEGGFSKIETYVYEDHVMLCRAATQCVTNMAMSPDVVLIYEGENDKLKMLTALCVDEDVETCKAASGAIAILTSASSKCCEKVFQLKSWLDALHNLLANVDSDIQYRGVCIIKNMMESTREVAERVIETDILEILMALTKLSDKEKGETVKVAEEALKSAEKWGIIKKPEASNADTVFTSKEIEDD